MRGLRIVFPAQGRVDLQEFDVPAIGRHEILIRTEISLVSAGTELTTLLNSQGTVKFPTVPGYSNVGIVDEVGSVVSACRPGDRVLTLGQHASHIVVDLSPDRRNGPEYTQSVPDGISSEEASFGILGSIAMHGVRKAEPQLKQTAAVIGQGLVGQLIAQLLRVGGCAPVLGIDTFPFRLEKTRESGTHVAINAAEQDVEAEVKAATDGRGVDLAFDATRNPQTILTLMRIATQSGKVIIVGSIPGTVEFPLYDPLQTKELTIIGVHQPRAPLIGHPYLPWTQSRNRLAFLELIRDGAIRVSHLLTHCLVPQDAARAYEMIRAGGTDWLGVAFRWQGG
jgi:2-desacetyl-2-hydroxyethyl bacteriochlorophyllide A dehydrogenase